MWPANFHSSNFIKLLQSLQERYRYSAFGFWRLSCLPFGGFFFTCATINFYKTFWVIKENCIYNGQMKEDNYDLQNTIQNTQHWAIIFVKSHKIYLQCEDLLKWGLFRFWRISRLPIQNYKTLFVKMGTFSDFMNKCEINWTY